MSKQAQTVLFLSPSSRLLGARRSLLQLVTHLDPSRYRPVVITKPHGDLVMALRKSKVECHPIFLGSWRKGKHFLARPWRIHQIAKVARKSKAALIHSNEFFSCPYGVRASNRAGNIPVISHMRLSITERQIRNYDLHKAARVICVSEAAARCFEKPWDDWRSRVEVVYNGVDISEFHPNESRSEARMRYRLGPEHFVIGQFGLISPRKQVHLLLEAMARLKEGMSMGLQPYALIVGSPGHSDAEYEKEVKHFVVKEGLQDMVRFIPFTPDVADIYRACDVNVLISNQEGFGRTIIEAGAMGIPSVGTRIGGIPELIIDGETGLLIEPNDDGSELADRLRFLISHHHRAIEMGQAAEKRVREHFTIAKHCEKIMHIYDRVIKEAS
ncbi:MAG: glycosyltransferase family 4 protein [Candidatus Sumerlaeia bacterium]